MKPYRELHNLTLILKGTSLVLIREIAQIIIIRHDFLYSGYWCYMYNVLME